MGGALRRCARELVAFARERSRQRPAARAASSPAYVEAAARAFDPDVLTIGFARRVATYKRLDLLTHDPERGAGACSAASAPVQIVFAGKAHPRDEEAKRVLQALFELQAARRVVGGRVVFLDDYDLPRRHFLVQGCDVWLNMPRPPLEASGTSGMKAAINGGLHLSVLDGWWAEGYDGANGWSLAGRRRRRSRRRRTRAMPPRSTACSRTRSCPPSTSATQAASPPPGSAACAPRCGCSGPSSAPRACCTTTWSARTARPAPSGATEISQPPLRLGGDAAATPTRGELPDDRGPAQGSDDPPPDARRRGAGRRGLLVARATGLAALGGATTAGAATTPSCILSPEEEEGPYYVDLEKVRSNIVAGRPGVPLFLGVYVLDSDSCEPIKNAAVDIWHCDALGIYSDEAVENTVGQTWLRGVQLTDKNGWRSSGRSTPATTRAAPRTCT